jgi:hypothetical protein
MVFLKKTVMLFHLKLKQRYRVLANSAEKHTLHIYNIKYNHFSQSTFDGVFNPKDSLVVLSFAVKSHS